MTSETSLVWSLIQSGETKTAAELVSEHRLSGWQSAKRVLEAVAPTAVLEPVLANGTFQTVRFQGLNSWAVLHLGDCLDMLPIEADAIISDPPYGMDWDTNNGRFSGGSKRRNPLHIRGKVWDSKVLGDDVEFDPSPWISFARVVLFGSNHFGAKLPIGTTLVWVKRYDEAFGTFLSDAEIAWMKGGHGVYCYRDTSGNGAGANYAKLHPTQKTVGVMAWTMKRAKVAVGQTVLDPYMGSGTTGIACLRTGRNFIGIEKDPVHFKTACDRFAREVDGQLL